jgi:hypothetical protein
MFDQSHVTTTGATFRASAKGGTVFPNSSLSGGAVDVYRPWVGTMTEYTNASGTNSYYSHGKTGLSPTYAAIKGFTVDVLVGDPSATQQFQQIRLHNTDYSYSVDLMGFKNTSTTDPLGYIWWTTLDKVTAADCTYNATTGVFSGSFASPLDNSTMYFINPNMYEFDPTAANSTTYSYISGLSPTDLLISGSMTPEPATMALLALGGVATLVRRIRGRKA